MPYRENTKMNKSTNGITIKMNSNSSKMKLNANVREKGKKSRSPVTASKNGKSQNFDIKNAINKIMNATRQQIGEVAKMVGIGKEEMKHLEHAFRESFSLNQQLNRKIHDLATNAHEAFKSGDIKHLEIIARQAYEALKTSETVTNKGGRMMDEAIRRVMKSSFKQHEMISKIQKHVKNL
jgi:hypothetical protein